MDMSFTQADPTKVQKERIFTEPVNPDNKKRKERIDRRE